MTILITKICELGACFLYFSYVLPRSKSFYSPWIYPCIQSYILVKFVPLVQFGDQSITLGVRPYGVVYNRNYLTNIITMLWNWKCEFSYPRVYMCFGKSLL